MRSEMMALSCGLQNETAAELAGEVVEITELSKKENLHNIEKTANNIPDETNLSEDINVPVIEDFTDKIISAEESQCGDYSGEECIHNQAGSTYHYFRPDNRH